jgi:2-polyprenyl-3-methyl-5-hydroxy-6-metoxy-1,4-benzoquinol methylase
VASATHPGDAGAAAVRAVATVSELAAVSRRLYTRGSPVLRKFLHLRPYICPLDRVMAYVPRQSTVLDVGCGGGLLLGLLAELEYEPRGLGFDTSRGALDLATAMAEAVLPRRPSASLRFMHLDAEADWPDERFDVVTLIDVLHHVPVTAQRSVFERACAHVRPGGLLIYKDMSPRPRWRAMMNSLHDLVVARQWVHYVRPDDVGCWAIEHHFERVAREHVNMLWYGHDLCVFRNAAPGASA